MGGLIKDTVEYYRRRKREAAERKTLINMNADFSMLERFIQRINENPSLKVRIVTRDGTRIDLHAYSERARRDFEAIDGNDWLEVR